MSKLWHLLFVSVALSHSPVGHLPGGAPGRGQGRSRLEEHPQAGCLQHPLPAMKLTEPKIKKNKLTKVCWQYGQADSHRFYRGCLNMAAE